MKKCLVINAGWEQSRLIQLLVDQGHEVYCVHDQSDYSAIAGVKEYLRIDYHDLAALSLWVEHFKPDAILSDQCDYSYFATAFLCDRFNLRGPSVEQAQIATNKYLQRLKGLQAGIRQPAFKLCSTLSEAKAAANDLKYPVIVKSIDNRGAFGVSRVTSVHEMAAAVQEALVHAKSRLFLVEQLISGTQVILDGYCFQDVGHKTLAVGSKVMMAGIDHLADDIIYPADLAENLIQVLIENNQSVIEKLAYKFGMTSAEYIVDHEGQPWLIEAANRGGGVCIASTIVPLVSGIDVTQQLICDALSMEGKFNQSEPARTASAYLKYLVFNPGQVASVEGIELAASLAGIEKIYCTIPKDGKVNAPTNAGGRQGMVIASGRSVEELKETMRRAFELIQVNYEDCVHERA